MNASKPWYLSRSVWGGVVSLGAGLAGLFGVGVDPTTSEALTVALTSASGAIGALVAIFGRVVADTSLR